MVNLSTALQSREPLVVGSAGTQEAIKTSPSATECDLVELRLDALGGGPEVRQFAEKQQKFHPLILTARHPDEGGSHHLTLAQRAGILEDFLPLGSLLDLELRSLQEMASLWQEAGARGIMRIASWHDFEKCPSNTEIKETIAAMDSAGANVAKCAFLLEKPNDLQRIAEALERPPLPVAIMGMGPLGPSSRLLAAGLGSVLNYGFLGETPTAPGQWPAQLLREAISASF
ncbi:MAG: type I 3-dehydroquinate dehydratase [Verrucomicrobiota bacterium]|nr:type I 3-dehydroquinate dehydratase [Verrucomicrobiota bacterium]